MISKCRLKITHSTNLFTDSVLRLCCSMGLSSFAGTQEAPVTAKRKLSRCDCRGSFKFTENGTIQNPLYDFLLVFHCKYMPVFYCVRDIMIYWSKVCVFSPFLVLPCTPDSFEAYSYVNT